MTTAIYLELMIEWHRDILATCHNDFDRRWKKGQIDMLQSMIQEIDNETLRNSLSRREQ